MNLLLSALSLILLSCSGGGELNNTTGSISNPSVTIEVTDTPLITGTTPASPAINNSPSVNGTAEANASVQIFSDSSCSTNLGTVTANDSGVFTYTDSLQGGETRNYYARATATGKSVSLCSTTTTNFKSNAIRPGLAWLNGTQTTAPTTPTRVNQATAYAIQWSSSEVDTTYYTHSTSTNSEVLRINSAGDYWLSATLPLIMTGGGTFRPCTRLEVRVNGTLVPGATGESSYIRYDLPTGNVESSSHLSMLLRGLSINDTVEVFLQETAGDNGGEIVNITGAASLLMEYINSSRDLFTGTATRTVGSTNINLAASALEWTEGRKDSSFTHNDGVNPEDITLSQNGDYLVTVNVPITSTAQRASPIVRVRLNGTVVNGGEASQGYMRADSGHNDSSIHWSGLIRGVNANDILTVTSEQGALAGTVNIQGTGTANITIEKVDTNSNVISLRATTLLGGGTNWNPAAKTAISWNTSDVIDTNVYTHSTLANQHQITVNQQGDYQLVYADSLSGANDRVSPHISVQVNGTDVTGAETKTHYIRNLDGHNESSASLVFLLRNLSANDIITVSTQEETTTATVNDIEETLLTIIKK